jgi:hypothetical protein
MYLFKGISHALGNCKTGPMSEANTFGEMIYFYGVSWLEKIKAFWSNYWLKIKK